MPNREEAYEALKASAMVPERGMDLRMQYGYIPCDLYNEAVAFDLEYAIADWSVAQVARELGKEEDYAYFLDRSKSYRHLFDPETHFLRGRDSKGGWRTPFDPFSAIHRGDDYCEGNAWQYTWLVPHDVEGLIECFGSKEAFTAKLDSLFTVSSELAGAASPDISGLIGQYAHGNEPSHHVLYFYTMIGQPWKTADKVREVLTTLYHDQPDGLSGNALSKSLLRVAVEQICQRHPKAEYFPSFEILNDELRDYRFYADDMTHPSDVAVDYIWQRFAEAVFDSPTRRAAEDAQRIVQASEHRPFAPDSEQYRTFCRTMANRIEALEAQYPTMDFAGEKEYFASHIG